MTATLQFLLDNGILLTVILLLCIGLFTLFRILLDEDRAAVLRGKVFHLAYRVSGHRDHEKAYVANDIKGRLNLARRELHHGTTLLPEAVRVEWVDGEEPGSYDVAEGQFVVRLDPAEQQHMNIVRLSQVVVERTSLLGLRHIMPLGMRRAFDFTLVKRLLRQLGSQRATDAFFLEVYGPQQNQDAKFDKWNPRLVEIDEQGLFERLLMVELEDYGRRIGAMEPRLYMLGEVEQLVRFVHRIATRKEREEVPLRFLKAHIRTGVILVAKIDKAVTEGIDPYVQAANINITDEADSFYAIVWDKPHLKLHRFKDWQSYRRVRGQLQRALERLPGVQWQFTWRYRYIDPSGTPRKGSISRFLVEQSADVRQAASVAVAQ